MLIFRNHLIRNDGLLLVRMKHSHGVY